MPSPDQSSHWHPMSKRRTLLTGISVALASPFIRHPASGASLKVRVGTQFGLAYLPLAVMEHDRLWEREAERRAMPVSVEYARIGGGDALNDALLSNSVELAGGGLAPMLLLADRTETTARVQSLAALNASPIDVLTNKPGIASVADFGPQDRIAVPSVRASIQAVTLMAAAERAFGPGQAGRLDTLTVPMQHPDALTALIAPKSQISGYVSSSPFQEIALSKPGVRR